MAVVMTTQFYEADTPAWHDLSKVVFTSPNMDSPNTAGTRSHILPGELDLGMWYEDVSNMYRIEDKQEFDTSTYFGYVAQIHDQFDIGDPPLYITIDQTDQSDWIEYIREMGDIGMHSYPMKYDKVAPAQENIISYTGATYSGIGYLITTLVVHEGDEGNAAPPILEGSIQFPVSFFPTKVTFTNYYSIIDGEEQRDYSTKTFRISSGGEELFYANTMTEDTTYSIGRDYFYYEDSPQYSNFYIELLEQNETPATISGVVMRSLLFYGTTNLYPITEITCSSGTNPENIFNNTGWSVDEEGTDPHWVTLSFLDPKRITKVIFKSLFFYEIKDYKIQACTTVSGTYVDLYSDRISHSNDDNTVTFSNYIGYRHYRFYIYSKYIDSNGYGIMDLELYEYSEDERITNPITLYIDKDNTIDISNANNAESTDYLFKLNVDSVDGTGVVASGTSVYVWGQTGTSDMSEQVKNVNSIMFEVTIGECYYCRLTAWDDVTHSTTLNHLIASDRCRVSCLVYNSNGNVLFPSENEGISFIHPPALNKIFKGDTVYEGENLYYGDFDMKYRTGSVLGDYLMFKPMLYDIDETVPYGVHDHVIVLHYSYT